MPPPGGNYHPAQKRPASRSFILGRDAGARDGPGTSGGLRALHLDPGPGRVVPRTLGRAFRPTRATLPGEGAAAPADQRVTLSLDPCVWFPVAV
jgi:hypothetical protein